MRSLNTGRKKIYIAYLMAFIVILVAGWIFRKQDNYLQFRISKPVTLPDSLSTLPTQIDNWKSKDIPLSETVQKVTGNDDYINRLYFNKSTNQWVNVYVAYSGRPRTMRGHNPKVCYVSSGWVHDYTQRTQIISSQGRQVPCLIHYFHRPDSQKEQIIVLNFYILNEKFCCSEEGFSGLRWRAPNVSGDPSFYVCQVQISSVLENSVRSIGETLSDLIYDFFLNCKAKTASLNYANN